MMARERGAALAELVAIMDRLLGPEGCPWDKSQTLRSLRPYVLEEAYEVAEAIDAGEPNGLCEELGDLLFQVVFQSAIARAEGMFDIDDVVRSIAAKMVRRHPWVFAAENDGATAPSGAPVREQTIARWEALKAEEKRSAGKPRGALAGVPKALPALLRAYRVGEKASAVGYDWPTAEAVRAKVDEELEELDVALAGGDEARAEEELGDLLFSLVNLGRKRGIDAESALRGALDRFSSRFEHAEAAAEVAGSALPDLDDGERDRLWEQAKAALGKP